MTPLLVDLHDVDAVARLGALRRAWTEENSATAVDDPGFDGRFAAWCAVESEHRWALVAPEHEGWVGMLNLTFFERMPQPGRPASRWCYLGNAFVLPEFRNRGIGGRLLAAGLALAREREAVRVVLAPSPRSVDFYRRAGFSEASMLLALELPTAGN